MSKGHPLKFGVQKMARQILLWTPFVTLRVPLGAPCGHLGGPFALCRLLLFLIRIFCFVGSAFSSTKHVVKLAALRKWLKLSEFLHRRVKMSLNFWTFCARLGKNGLQICHFFIVEKDRLNQSVSLAQVSAKMDSVSIVFQSAKTIDSMTHLNEPNK